MKLKSKANQGFTLIELLVVITIIAILASLSTPVFNKVRTNARVTAAVNNARQLSIALISYAGDNGGAFPEAEESANDGLRQLFPVYLDQEKVFWLNNSIYCRATQPDEEIGGGDSGNENALQPGELHFAYVSGYADTDKSTYPIVADAFTVNDIEYDENHAWWTVRKAVVVSLDGAAQPYTIVPGSSEETGRVLAPGKDKTNLFDPSKLGRGKVFLPEKP